MDYTLSFSSIYDEFNPNGYISYFDGQPTEGYCGKPGQRSGLTATFSDTDLRQIPFRQTIEIPFMISISPAYNGINLCNVFNQIQLEIVATCEIPNSDSHVYQYDVSYNTASNQVEVLYNSVLGPTSSFATFSVSWPSTPLTSAKVSLQSSADASSHLSTLSGNEGSFGAATDANSLLAHLDSKFSSVNEKMSSMTTCIYMLAGGLAAMFVILFALVIQMCVIMVKMNRSHEVKRASDFEKY